MSPNNKFQFISNGFEKKGYEADEAADFDRAIALTGYGRFHFKIIIISAFCLMISGVQNGLSSYVFSAAQCELPLTSADIGWLNVCFLCGGITSAFLWGTVADLIGRRRVLYTTLLLDFCVTLTASLMQNFGGLAFCRYFNGFLIGAEGSITFNYIAEFHSPKHRAKSVCYSGMFFTLAWLILPLLSFLIIPIPQIDLKNNIHLSSWRLFLMIISVPELLTGLWMYFMPESPKFLAEKGEVSRALKILEEMFASNQQAEIADYPVKHLIVKEETELMGKEGVACIGKVKRMLGEMFVQMKKLFKPPIAFITFLICAIMFCNMFGYFGLGLWLPELFIRFQQYQEQFPNESVTVQHLASLKVPTDNNCSAEFDWDLFQSTLAIGISSLFGNIISGYFSGKVSIKLIPIITMLIGGLASGSIYWLQSSLQNLLIACIFQASMATANVAISSVAVELFPTTVAAMALCLTILMGRLGAMVSNVVFGLLMDNRCEIPIFLVSSILLFGTILCIFIPKNNQIEKDVFKKNMPLDISVISNEQTIS